jgi:putative SOS response-associated peptidase YedK
MGKRHPFTEPYDKKEKRGNLHLAGESELPSRRVELPGNAELQTKERAYVPITRTISTSPNELVEHVHNRMSVILRRDCSETWLSVGTEDVDEPDCICPASS